LTNDIFEDLDAVCGSRQALYSFLSRLFERELTEGIIKELQERTEAMAQLAPLKELGNKKLNEGLMNLESYLKELVSKPREKVTEGLSVEFKGLLLGVWGSPDHPSESEYASGSREAKEKRKQVKEIYQSVGLDKADAFNEPEDHVAVELQFMS
jgi:TorA maturation chaperone TorD